ncbi:LysR substrate-binding domain-containing protein [Marinilabiliaceae bacterium ANBcel2]|nr:LysR substrate-binding domain-containing protein [Marinilabiliaceae bacterium ANBcel2]
MNLQQLEYIVALDEYRHFVTAAEKCFVTQPTLTMQLKRLEDEIGIQLFDRTRKPLIPTGEGEAFIARARRILRDLNDLENFLVEEKKSIEGVFRIGVIPTLAPYVLPLFLDRFSRENPKTYLKIEELKSESIIKALHNDHLDLGIMATPAGEKDLKETLLFNEPFLFYGSYNHPFLKEERVDPDKLDRSSLLLLAEGHCFRDQALNICNEKGDEFVSMNFHYESGSVETLKRLVQSGLCYTLVPQLSVSDFESKNVKRFISPEPVREVSLVSHISFNKTALIDSIKAIIQEELPGDISTPHEVKKIKWR